MNQLAYRRIELADWQTFQICSRDPVSVVCRIVDWRTDDPDIWFDKPIEFPNGLVVTLGEELGRGHARIAYATDYVDEQGREYVVKKARYAHGTKDNILEYRISEYAKNSVHKHMFPIFAQCSADGVWLLVERCQTAQAARPNEMIPRYAHPFPAWFNSDSHAHNWGYTLKGDRPVILDMGYDDKFDHILYWLGIDKTTMEEVERYYELNATPDEYRYYG